MKVFKRITVVMVLCVVLAGLILTAQAFLGRRKLLSIGWGGGFGTIEETAGMDITVYTNCEEVTLLVNGVEYETRAAEHHAVVFENVPLALGENTLTATYGELADTIVLKGVEQHNEAYTLPDIAAAMQVGNWFDDIKDDDDSDVIEQPEGFYSIEDSLIELMANPECHKIMKGWLVQQGSLSMASTLESMRDMMGTYTFHSLSMYLDTASRKDWAQVNRMLNKVRKTA